MANHGNQRGRDEHDRVQELEFDDQRPPPRAGDPRVVAGHPDPEISPRRSREAGMTAGETGGDITDDDLGPETLLDEEHSIDPPADKRTRIVDADEIGAGYGLDEAELARAETDEPDPVPPRGH